MLCHLTLSFQFIRLNFKIPQFHQYFNHGKKRILSKSKNKHRQYLGIHTSLILNLELKTASIREIIK